MNITLINIQPKERNDCIIFKLKTDWGNYDLALSKLLEIDWNWQEYSPFKRSEKYEIEVFIKQYVFDKFREVV